MTLTENMREVLAEFSRYEQVSVRSGARDNRRRNALRALQRRALVAEGSGPMRDTWHLTPQGKAVLATRCGLAAAAPEAGTDGA